MSNLNYNLKEKISIEHRRAELDRLVRGMEGCGCIVCQELYQTLDLTKYGGRAKNYAESSSGSFILISGRKSQPEEKEKEGQEIKVEIEPALVELVETPERIMKQVRQRGRPRKEATGAVSRVTKWRQNKRGQGILV